MRVLQIHNYYQRPGGEDVVVANEERLLTKRGHQVWQFLLHNDAIAESPKFQVAVETLWNRSAYQSVRQKIQKYGIDLVHAHNTFPLISPAVYYAAQDERVPVVQSLHNYRLLCPAATFFRDGSPCEECLGHAPLPAVWHRCYRGSLSASATTAVMLGIHHAIGTYANKVNAYVAMSQFALCKFVQGGLPRNRMRVKPNFLVDDPGVGSGYGGYALFVGRLVVEKGVDTLLKAWRLLKTPIRLKIAGDGPLRSSVESASQTPSDVEYVGQCSHDRIYELMRHATVLVFPSEWYEGSPLSVIEALACGTPVVSSNGGSMQELIVPGKNGFLFRAGDVSELVKTLDSVFSNGSSLEGLRYSSRQYYEAHLSPARNYETLMDIYNGVLPVKVR